MGDVNVIISEARELMHLQIMEAKVSSEADLKELVLVMAKKAFGDKVDMAKVDGMVANAIKDNTKDGEIDWKAASGQAIGGFNEGVDLSLAVGDDDDPPQCGQISLFVLFVGGSPF